VALLFMNLANLLCIHNWSILAKMVIITHADLCAFGSVQNGNRKSCFRAKMPKSSICSLDYILLFCANVQRWPVMSTYVHVHVELVPCQRVFAVSTRKDWKGPFPTKMIAREYRQGN
jgi:hypothetical protein